MNGLENLWVVTAAAHIPVHPLLDISRRRLGLGLEQRDRRHDHAGGAIAALESAFLQKRLLHRMQLFAGSKPFDCQDSFPFSLLDRRAAREDALSVEQHRTGATSPF